MTDITQRDLEALRTTVDKLDRTLESFRQEMASVYARKDVLDPTIRDLRGDVEELKAWVTWAQRIVLGMVLVALLGAVLVQGSGGVG